MNKILLSETDFTKGFLSIVPCKRRFFIPFSTILSPLGAYQPAVRHQFGHPQEIIRYSYKPCLKSRPISSFISGFPESSNCLHPPEYLFHPLSDTLAYGISLMSGSSSVYGRAAFSFGVGRNMRGDIPASYAGNKIFGIVSFIRSKGFWLYTFLFLPGEHLIRASRSQVPVAGVTCISTRRPFLFSISAWAP